MVVVGGVGGGFGAVVMVRDRFVEDVDFVDGVVDGFVVEGVVESAAVPSAPPSGLMWAFAKAEAELLRLTLGFLTFLTRTTAEATAT